VNDPIPYDSVPLSDQEAADLKGKPLDGSHYRRLLGGPGGEDTDEFKLDGRPLLVYRRRVPAVLEALNGRCVAALRQVAAKGSYQLQAPSGIIGFMDPTPREPYCRTSKFTQDHPELVAEVQPLLIAMDRLYRGVLPDRYALQAGFARGTSQDFIIPGTCFTTATVNATHAYRAHRHDDNLACGFSVMVVWRRGEYGGGYTVLPQYKIAVDMLCGDVMLFDGRDYHGNTAFIGTPGTFERISVVAYYRRHMLGAGSAAEELAKSKRKLSGPASDPRPR
jgi:hypothetical protein